MTWPTLRSEGRCSVAGPPDPHPVRRRARRPRAGDGAGPGAAGAGGRDARRHRDARPGSCHPPRPGRVAGAVDAYGGFAESRLVAHAEAFGPKELVAWGGGSSTSCPRDRRAGRGRPPRRPRGERCGQAQDDDAAPGRRHHPHLCTRLRTRPRRGSRPTSRRSPTLAPSATTSEAARRPTRSPGCPTRSVWVTRSASFLEAIDPARLPLHGGDATTVVVTIPLASLRAELGAADLIGAGLVPGDDLTGDRITAAQAVDWRAPRRSFRRCSTALVFPSTSAEPSDSSARPSARRS